MADNALKTPILSKKASATKAAPAKPPMRPFATKSQKEKKSDFQRLVDSAAFVLCMGLLITATGLILLIAFHNRLSKYTLDVGLVLSLYSIGIKFLDICLKLLGVRS